MSHKSFLSLMEQLIMVLVFALAAALCVQIFVFSNRASQRLELRDRAVIEVQSIAEILKDCHGDYVLASSTHGGCWDGHSWHIDYNETWSVSNEDVVCHIEAVPTNIGQVEMGGANIAAYDADGEPLFDLSVAWQEVMDRG